MIVTESKQKPRKKKSAPQRLWSLHWWMTLFYVLLFIGGRYLIYIPEDASYRETFFDFHKTLGVVVMALLLARISVLVQVLLYKYRRRQPKRKPSWVRTVVLHLVLYVFMLLVPITGFFDSNVGDHDVRIIGTGIVLPRLFPVNKALDAFGDSVHFWFSYVFLAFIILHAIDQKKYLRSQVRRFSQAAIASFSSKGNSSK
ncbi:MAG TPA: cytochrome B [Cyanobacteria bacterium UBA11368]|nr:cytochrome B [Cyanobacteria bacterium UBA11368]